MIGANSIDASLARVRSTSSLYQDALLKADQLRDQGDLELAIAAYQDLTSKYPSLAEPWYKLGTALMRKGNCLAAIAELKKALSIHRAYPEAHNNLALSLVRSSRFDEALNQYRTGLSYAPDFDGLHLGIGNLLVDLHQGLEAIYHFRRALTLRPDSLAARHGLALALRKTGRLREAIEVASEGLAAFPDSAELWNTLGACFYSSGRMDLAANAFEKSVSLDPENVDALNNVALVVNYASINRQQAFETHANVGRLIASGCVPISRKPASPKNKITVGMVSGDLRRHSVANFLIGPLETIDRSRFRLIAYFNHNAPDEISEGLSQYFDEWIPIRHLSDEVVANRVQSDGVDVLIDLAGHTHLSRLGVFALRPASVQLAWIGYPNTTGLSEMDYRLTDRVADPGPEDDLFHTESLWRLPGCFICFRPVDKTPDVAPLPAIKNHYVTFGSFNARTKISPECVRIWSAVLREVTDSRLILKSYAGFDDDEGKQELIDLFVAEGVGPERLTLRGSIKDEFDHLASYSEVDVALDSIPYNGTTTTCQALWMGVPVVTLKGDRHASRVGASLLTATGLGDLVADDEADFVSIAMALAADRDRLAAFRHNLRQHVARSPLCDVKQMGEKLGAALESMCSLVQDADVNGR